MEQGRQSTKSHKGPRKQQWSPKSSQKSKSSTSSGDPRTKAKNFCRGFAEFMCTQVGVGGLVISYAVLGALAFMAIETTKGVRPPIWDEVDGNRTKYLSELWNITYRYNVLKKEEWKRDVTKVIKRYENMVIDAIKERDYDPEIIDPQAERWTFSVALMYTLSVFTMIGYGAFVPKTELGKIVTMCYAVFGIPMYVLYLNSMGRVLAGTFRWLYIKMYKFRCRKKEAVEDPEDIEEEEEQVLVPYTACLWVMVLYITVGTIMFSEWEKWGILNSVYFCVTSLCKIGPGDFVPGAAKGGSESEQTTDLKLVNNFIFLLLGMGLIAMCYILMKEEIHVKFTHLKMTAKAKLQRCSEHIGFYREPHYDYGRPRHPHYDKGYDRQYDKSYDRSYDRSQERGHDKGYARGSDRGYDRSYDRQYR